MPKLQSLVDRATLGASGRIWKLPFDAVAYGHTRSVSFNGPLEQDCAALACTLVRDADPKLFGEWRGAFLNSRSGSPQRPDSRSSSCLTSSTFTFPLSPLMSSAPATPTASPPPTKVDVPDISPDHWYYKRHFTVGSYRAPVAVPDSEKIGEVAQDIASLRFYLGRYDSLARETTGQNLFEATTWALFRAPYFSCMEMCIRDLALPSHFLALIHHGIGAHLAIGQPYLSWNHRATSAAEQLCLQKTLEVFNCLTKLYREDFGKDRGSPNRGAA